MCRQTNFVEFSIGDKFVYVDMNKVTFISQDDYQEYLSIYFNDPGISNIKVDADNLKTIQQLMTQEKI